MPSSKSASCQWNIYRGCVCPLPSRPTVGLIRRSALAPYHLGDALWSILCRSSITVNQPDVDRRQPGPIPSYKRVRIGDVGYIRKGRFHLLFSAGIPLGSRTLGTDVPRTFEHLNVGLILQGDARPPGHLRTDSVREIGGAIGGSGAVAWCVCTYPGLVDDRCN